MFPAAQPDDPYLRPSFSVSNRMGRLAWSIIWTLLFRPSPRPFHSWRQWEFRAGVENTGDFQTRSVLNLWYVSLRYVF